MGTKSLSEIREELNRFLIHTDNRMLFIIRTAVDGQDVFHCSYNSGVLLRRNTPAFLQVRLKFVFLSIRETVTWEMSSI